MVCTNGKITCTGYSKKKIRVGDVKIKVKKVGEDDYVLTRTVDGKKNYETKSHYQKTKTTGTTKKNNEKNKKRIAHY